MNEAFLVTRKHLLAAWIVLSASLMIIGAVGPWLTVSTALGGISFSGTFIGSKSGSAAFGAGWEVLGAAIIAGVIGLLALFHSPRWPIKLAGLIGALALVETIYVMIRSASALLHSSEYATASWGWGLLLSLLASISLTSALFLTAVRWSDRTVTSENDPPRTASRRLLALIIGIALFAIAGVAAGGVVIAHKQAELNRSHDALAMAQAEITQFPDRLSAARDEGHSAGVSEEDSLYAGCYDTSYANGYLGGWNAAVSEMTAAGSVAGGPNDAWYDSTSDGGSCLGGGE
jgi:hypothetical protein